MMQLQHPTDAQHTRAPGRSVARAQDGSLSDAALVGLLGGIYVGGLASFLGMAHALSQLL